MATSADDQDGWPARAEAPRAEWREALLRDAGVPLYLREIGAVALLTAAEEQALAAALERGLSVRGTRGGTAPQPESNALVRSRAPDAVRA